MEIELSPYITGYLDRTIKNPSISKLPALPLLSPKALISITTTEMNWESLTPTPNKWNVWNAWVMALLIYNTKNSVGLRINIDSSAADAWKSYKRKHLIWHASILSMNSDA